MLFKNADVCKTFSVNTGGKLFGTIMYPVGRFETEPGDDTPRFDVAQQKCKKIYIRIQYVN